MRHIKRFAISAVMIVAISGMCLYVFAHVLSELSPLPGDMNCDGKVDMADVPLFQACAEATPEAGHPAYVPQADLNNDGKVDFNDAPLFAFTGSSNGSTQEEYPDGGPDLLDPPGTGSDDGGGETGTPRSNDGEEDAYNGNVDTSGLASNPTDNEGFDSRVYRFL